MVGKLLSAIIMFVIIFVVIRYVLLVHTFQYYEVPDNVAGDISVILTLFISFIGDIASYLNDINNKMN